MKNEPKTDVLLRMMEQPERYTEEQWRDILSDSECRELYTLMAMTRGSLDAAKADAELTDEEIEEEWKKVKDPPITLQDPPITLPVREGVVTFEEESTLPSNHSTPSLTGRVRGGSALHSSPPPTSAAWHGHLSLASALTTQQSHLSPQRYLLPP